MQTHWQDRSKHWGLQGPPLQPNPEVVDYFTSKVATDQHILLLGVTPQIAQVYQRVTAVDYSASMIERVWPGNTATKTAVLQNWLDYTPNKPFDAVIGDGSVNMLHYPTEIKLFFKRLPLWLKPGAPLICRIFTRFDEPVTITRIFEELETNKNFAAWRRLLNMYLAEQHGPLVRHSDVLNLFETLFPDRTQLPFAPELIAKMDAYRGATTSTWFPTRSEFLAEIPDNIEACFEDVGTYDHSTAYPIITCRIKES